MAGRTNYLVGSRTRRPVTTIPIWHILLWNISLRQDNCQYMNKTIYSKEHKYIVEQLKKAREKVGLSQEQVAKILHKTQSYISKIEAGQRKINVVQLKKFAEIYKKPLDYFIKR